MVQGLPPMHPSLAAALSLLSRSRLAKPCRNLHHIHHHTVVLLESHEPLPPHLRDQGEEVYIELYVWIPRRRCSCGASSDQIGSRG